MLIVRLPSGRTRLFEASGDAALLQSRIEDAEGLPRTVQRLVAGQRVLRSGDLLDSLGGLTVQVLLPLLGGGGDGDQPDWTERGKMPSGGSKKRGPDARAPDWHGDAAKYTAKIERDKRERGELLIAVGPYCVPCGKRFAKQTVFDAHLSGQKHLRALEKLGRAEEAMVCRLDVEAKKRKMGEARESADAARKAEMSGSGSWGQGSSGGDDEEAARRRAEREEKLRQRSLLPMPATVSAASVYEESGGVAPTGGAPLAEPDAAELAAAAAGTTKEFYKTGMQDLSGRTNRFTSTEKMEIHRKMAIAPSDWFGCSIHDSDSVVASEASESVGQRPSDIFTPGLRIVGDKPAEGPAPQPAA